VGGAAATEMRFDLRTNTIGSRHFPYSVWSRLMREAMRDEPERLVSAIHPQGDLGLRGEIARYLGDYRGMAVEADQIVLGAGTEYLLGLITELLPSAVWAIEEPSYPKSPGLLRRRGVPYCPVRVDGDGLVAADLARTDADAALITPSHQFPLSVTMSISRRQQLLRWARAREGRFLVEDDFNSGYHFGLRPIPSLYSLDNVGKVIYLNSFANSLAPSLRIAYMVLPPELLRRYQESLNFYSCTVSAFEQVTLKLFLQRGYFDRHLGRMRKVYKTRQASLIEGLAPLGDRISVRGQQAGLHLLVCVPDVSERELVARAGEEGVGVYQLSGYYLTPPPETHTVVLGFAGLQAEQLSEAAGLLVRAWG
jgi:GntR family transcriptional regulator/MocR family aminotransferase